MIEKTPRYYETILLKCVLCANGEVIFFNTRVCWHNKKTKHHMFPHECLNNNLKVEPLIKITKKTNT